ncbi:GAF domain-containing protein [Muricoccus radiodurans]|uniref:GAF domain-containing protein n=1 Tax=Muricoccus radiodurans TaxID=2231721 RepID=UPI003CEB2D30
MTLEDHLARCATALSDPAGPPTLYQAVQDSLGALLGHRLFTLLITTPDGTEVERIWTSDPEAYPLQGRKRMGPTPWGAHVLQGQRPWMCNDAEGIRWAFPDSALIESLGLGSCINIPVVAFGRTLGTLNILDRPGAYPESGMETARLFGALLVLPYAEAARA